MNGTVWTDVWVENVVGTSNAFTLTVGGTVVAQGTASNHATLAWDSPLDPGRRDHAHGDGARRGRPRRGRHPRSHRPQRPRLVFITSPPAGAMVGGVVWSDIWVEGAAAGTRTFTLSISGTTLATASASGNHVTLPWDSSRVANGPPGDRRDGARRGRPRRDRHPRSHRPTTARAARGVHHEPAGRRDRRGSRVVRHLGRGGGGGDPDLHAVDRRHHARHGERQRQPRHAALGLLSRGQRPPGDRRHGPRRRRSQRGRHALRQHPEQSSGGAGTAPRSAIAPTR